MSYLAKFMILVEMVAWEQKDDLGCYVHRGPWPEQRIASNTQRLESLYYGD